MPGLLFRGTKWCGQGTIASNYYDLGEFEKEDSCCREHDHCPNTLAPDECLQNVCNDSPFTRSHCDCDMTFRNCLKNLGTETANTLGTVFFNVVHIMCFKEACNSTQCWQEVHTMPPFTDNRKNLFVGNRQNPDIFTLILRTIKNLFKRKFENSFINRFFRTLNFHEYF